MSHRTQCLLGLVCALALPCALVTAPAHAAPDTPAPTDFAKGHALLAQAQASRTDAERKVRAIAAAEHFEASARTQASWRAAAGAADAWALAGHNTLASAWYWIASDASDYSDAYIEWQTGALDRIFGKRAAVLFEFSEPPRTLQIGATTIPLASRAKELALEPGRHVIAATSDGGGTFRGELVIDADYAGPSLTYDVEFARPAAQWNRPEGPPSTSSDGMSPLQIVNVVLVTTLATGIAIGGGYLLLGTDNPRGFDSPEGVVVIATEVVLIGAGVTIAIVSD